MTRIETYEQYRGALKRVEELARTVDETTPDNSPEKIEYVLLSGLVADYSDARFDLGKPSLAEVIKERMFELGLNQSEVSERLGISQSRVSEIVSGKAEPTLKVARKISTSLDIPPAIVLGV